MIVFCGLLTYGSVKHLLVSMCVVYIHHRKLLVIWSMQHISVLAKSASHFTPPCCKSTNTPQLILRLFEKSRLGMQCGGREMRYVGLEKGQKGFCDFFGTMLLNCVLILRCLCILFFIELFVTLVIWRRKQPVSTSSQLITPSIQYLPSLSPSLLPYSATVSVDMWQRYMLKSYQFSKINYHSFQCTNHYSSQCTRNKQLH